MIEFERRFSKTFPRLDLDLAYQGDIQQLLESMTDEKGTCPFLSLHNFTHTFVQTRREAHRRTRR